jgi:uncharacterized protein with PIN domain
VRRDPKAVCPTCNKPVDRVDEEYARHYVRGALCLSSKREIMLEQQLRPARS